MTPKSKKKNNKAPIIPQTKLNSNETSINRTPSAAVQRVLKEEVGYCCPAPRGNGRCGNPYLTWHHFDPPWEEKHHQNPEGMIALCRVHHDQADHGAYIKDQLRQFKEQARNQPIEIKEEFSWRRHNLLAVVGGNAYYKTPTILQYREYPIIWFECVESYQLLNLDFLPLSGKLGLQMRNNGWQVYDNLDNMQCSPSGKTLSVKFKNHDTFRIEFHEMRFESSFVKKYPWIDLSSDITFPFTAVEIQIKVKEINFELGPKRSKYGLKAIMEGCIFENLSSAVKFS